MSAPFPRGLYAIVDLDSLGIRDPAELARAALAGGAVAVQLRAKTAPATDALDAARRLLPLCQGAGVPLIVNDRVDVAIAAGAQGVHVGQRDLEAAEVRRQIAGTVVRWVGVSTHDLAQVRAAEGAAACDYLGFGPVFSTRNKTAGDPAVGLAGVEAAVRACRLPIVAIGGIGPGSAREIAALGAHAVAVIDALARAEDPRAVADAFREAFA
jgi:thiamine-phosphate pyrophosphorylase